MEEGRMYGDGGMKMEEGVYYYYQEVPVSPLKPVRVRERVVTLDGKPVFRMEEDVLDEETGLVADSWRCITDNAVMKRQLKEAAHNFPRYVRIVKDEETLVAECNVLVTIQVGGFKQHEIVIYPLLGRGNWYRIPELQDILKGQHEGD
jgi:hypothetical protein